MAHDWRPRAAAAVLRERARLLECIRAFMKERGILEVETPVLSAFGNPDPQLDSFRTRPDATGSEYYLHTSPEFPMKRLLADGSGPIYQIARVFRAAESGRHHQPEFTLLEWYRPGFDHHALMDEIDDLLERLSLPRARRRTYEQVFLEHTGLDPHAAADADLRSAAQAAGLASAADLERGALLDFLFSHRAAPHLGHGQPWFIYDFPACQAALARLRREVGVVRAERFELFINNMEIANGYNELTDYSEQESRFDAENQQRRQRGLPAVAADPQLLAALQSGLPDCAGVALGLDRLLLVLTGADRLADVMAFPHG